VSDKKKQEPSSQGKSNPWIYNVSRLYGGLQESAAGFSAERLSESTPMQRSPLAPGRRRWPLLLILLVSVLVVAAGLVIILAVIR
jgi:hypothetical protein